MTNNRDVRKRHDGLQRELRALGRLDARDDEFGRELRARLLQRADDAAPASKERTPPMATIAPVTTSRPIHSRHSLLVRIVSIAAAIVLVLGGVMAYLLHAQTPTAVSAQTILQRAAQALAAPAPDDVLHVSSTFYDGQNQEFGTGGQTLGAGPITYTVDEYTQFDAAGAISRQVTTATDITGTLMFRMLRTGQMARLYGTRANMLEEFQIPKSVTFSWADNPLGIASPQQLVLAARQNQLRNVRLLPAQSLDGVMVDVIESSYTDQVPPGVKVETTRHVFRLYIDARNYTIRGLDALDIDAGGATHVTERMRVTRRETVPLSSLPSDTFTLNAPAPARVVPPSSDLLSVAQAVARPGEPDPLLSGDAQGLRLQYVMFAHATQYMPASLVYYYQAGLSFPGAFNTKTFIISIAPTGASAANAPPASSGAKGTRMALTFAGKAVQATYVAPTAGGNTQQMTYQEGGMTVQISGSGLSKDGFFAAIRALVDGHTRPDVVTALQRELDTPQS